MKDYVVTVELVYTPSVRRTIYKIVQGRNGDSAKNKAAKWVSKTYQNRALDFPCVYFKVANAELVESRTIRFYRGERERALKAIPYYEGKIKQFQEWLADAKSYQATLYHLIGEMERLTGE